MQESVPLRQRLLGAARQVASPRVKQVVRRTAGRPLVHYERRGLTPELTVVMPVYNVAEYLPAALDSALTQSLHNLELIAVDDSSTDGSLAILRDYERRDPRVKVFTQPNSGQGVARNLAVQHARGEFLTFMDSDDTVPPGAFSHMVERLRASGSDFCVGGVRRFKHDEYIRTVWARTVHSRDRIGTTIEQFPNAMQDIIACNRMFRTAFWRERVGDFRGHIAYEDHVPMLTAYVRAERFDILTKVTYNWRIRENKTSTGQQKARLENLLDRIAVKEEAYELLTAEASDFVYDTWVGRTLEVDFPPFIAHAINAGDSYRNILAATYRTYLDRATDQALGMVTVRQKIRSQLAAQGRWQDISAADAWFDDHGLVPPTMVQDGEVVARVPDDLPFLQGLPDAVRRLSPLECHFEGVLSHVEWAGDTLRLTGWAVRRALGVEGPATFTAWLEDDTGERVDLPVRGVPQPDASLWGLQQFARYDDGGFVADIDVAALTARRPGSWHFHVEITHDGITTGGTLALRVTWSGALRDTGRTLEGRAGPTTVRTRWDAARGLTLDVDPDPVLVESLSVADGTATGTLLVPEALRSRDSSVALRRPDGTLVKGTATGQAGARLTFRVPVPATAGPSAGVRRWELVLDSGARRTAPSWPRGLEEPAPGQAAGWVRSLTAAPVLSVPSVPRFEVTAVDLGDDTLSVTMQRAGLTDEVLAGVALGNARLSLDRIGVEHDGPLATVTFSLLADTVTGSRRPAPSAVYDLTLPLPAGPLPATVADSLSGRLPLRPHGRLFNLNVGQDAEGRLRLALKPPLPPEARGAYGVRRLRDHYREAPIAPTDSVLFGCYRGEFATDSQLALDRALALARPGITRYWGVADSSTEVPEGSVPLLIGSQQWYDALASSRWLCNNIDFGPFFRRRPHQRYLQTFHGYPFKSMGIGFWRGKGLTDEQVARAVARANREWDVILVPSKECEAYYREQYDWTGEVLVAGYPRCDALVTADAAAVRTRVLGTLGIDTARTVVLYAPTYRDRLTTRTYAARRFDDLDLDRLAGRLGDDFVLLVRGHNNNQRELDRVRGMARVVDVTDWPDVNDLTLAADAAILDYSSLRFDWALTGKPMVFFVPDRESYFTLREPLFSYEGTAPGPWLSTTDEVADRLADLPALRRGYAAEIAAFNERFNGLHDGHASERVLQTFFADLGAVPEGDPT